MTTHATHRGFAGNAARLFVLLAALGLLAALAVDQRPWERLLSPEPSFGVVLDGRHFRVDSGTAEAIGRQSRIQADLGGERAADRVRELLAGELDRVFAELKDRVPDYADWYFSLTGEYTRLSLLILQRVGWQNSDQFRERAQELIFGGDEFAERLAGIEGLASMQLAAHVQEQRAAWLAGVLQLLAPEAEKAGTRGDPVAMLALDDLAAEFSGHGRSEFLTRVSASAAGAGSAGIAAPLLARVAVRPAAAAAITGGGLAARGASRGAARAGATGASVLGCAATGPAALACAVLVGGAAWVAADWALLSVDEWRHRDALIAEWEQRLDLLRAELEAALLAHYAEAVSVWRDGLTLEVERTFSPLESIRAGRS
jgi:hypothetical protein